MSASVFKPIHVYVAWLTMSSCSAWAEVWAYTAPSPSNTFFVLSQNRTITRYRAISLSSANNQVSAVWLKDYEPAELQLYIRPENLQSNATALKARGYRPVCLAVYGQIPNESYIVSYVRDGRESSLFSRLTASELGTIVSASPDSRVAWLQSSGAGEDARYAGVLARDGLAGKLELGVDEAAMRSAISSNSDAGYRPVCVFATPATLGSAYSAAWVQEGKRWTNRFNLSAAEFNAYLPSLTPQNLRLEVLTQYLGEDQQTLRFGVVAVENLPAVWTATGTIEPGMESLDQAMTNAMKAVNCTRATLAVSRNGRLVVSRGYTYHPASVPATQPTNLFRLASISKTITAVTVMGLVEAGKLQLDDKLEKFVDISGVSDTRWTNITVRHLLQHRGGWNRATTFDPLFYDVNISTALGVPLPITHDHIITFMKRQPLQAAPGVTYAYSNFGYLLLGRIIEAVTGQDYETFVRQNVLAPLGIHSARVGRTKLADRLPGEVEYIEGLSTYASVLSADRPQVENPYGRYNLENLGAVGMWVFSAEDLVRYCSIFTEKTNCALLLAQTIDTMWAPAPQDRPPATGAYSYYASGWVVQGRDNGPPIYVLHDGSLPGTRTLLIYQGNGYSWAALFNTRNEGGTDPITALNGGLSIVNSIAAVPQWPTYDLFDIDADNLPDSYEFAHFGSLSASDGSADHDGDGLTDAGEWIAMSNPVDAANRPIFAIRGNTGEIPALQVTSGGGRVYTVYSNSTPGQNWDSATTVARFNGDGFTRVIPVPATEPEAFYRLRFELRAQPIRPGPFGASGKTAESARIYPWEGIPKDLVPRDDP